MKKVRLLPLLLALSLLLSGCSSTLEQTIPAETETKEKEIVEDQKNSLAIFNPSSDDELNIMMIGNSNCYYWTDELYGILTEAGYQNVSVCNVYYSGCTFEKHWNWLRGDEANYEFFIHNSRGKNAQKNVSLKTALAYQNWDAFFLVSGNSKEVYAGNVEGYENPLRAYLPLVVNYLREKFPCAEYYWQQIWAQGLGKRSTSLEVQAQAAADFKAVSLRLTKDFNLINVPQGDAWQTVRHDPLIREDGKKTLNTRIFQGKSDYDDQIHDGDVGGGQYLNACVFFEVLTKKSCVGTSYRPQYTYKGKDMSLSEEKIALLQKTAHEAVAKAYGEDFAQ